MIVLDASVVVELVLNGPLAARIRREMAEADDSFIVPHLVDVEVLSAVRRISASKFIDAHRASRVLEDLASLPAERFDHSFLCARIWELRNNFTAYDATYIALAELTSSVLFTCDAKLQKGHRARVVCFAQA